jgi:hypothetical protein
MNNVINLIRREIGSLEDAVGEDWNIVLHCIGWKEMSERAVRWESEESLKNEWSIPCQERNCRRKMFTAFTVEYSGWSMGSAAMMDMMLSIIFIAAAWCSLCVLLSLCGAASSNSMAYNNASFDVPLFLDIRFELDFPCALIQTS